jgi:pimeloyl-ACP methyl ester carboxylesterase
MWSKLIFLLIVLFVLYLLALFKLNRMAPKSHPVTESSDTKLVHLDDSIVRYQESGQGSQAIILLHGFNANLTQFDGVWSELTASDPLTRVIRLDIPGYGASYCDSKDFSLDQQAQRIIQLMNALDVEQAVFVGISMGASLSAWIAANHPDRVIGTVLAAPSGYSDSLNYPGHFGAFLKPGALNIIATFLARTSVYQWLYPDSKALHALSVTSSYGTPWVMALNKIRQPLVLIWSTGDQATPFSYAKLIKQKVSNSLLITLPHEIGHDVERCSRTIAFAARTLLNYKNQFDKVETILSAITPRLEGC